MSAEVLHYGHSWFALCLACAWRSGPQESKSDAADRAVTHDYFNHEDSPAAIEIREMEQAYARTLDEQAKESAS